MISRCLSGADYAEAMDTSEKCTGADIASTRLCLNWIKRVSATPNLLLVLTCASRNMLAVTTHYSCEEIQVPHGMPDPVAVTGKLFYYPISLYAFQGKQVNFR